jgi:hypothetical protein
VIPVTASAVSLTQPSETAEIVHFCTDGQLNFRRDGTYVARILIANRGVEVGKEGNEVGGLPWDNRPSFGSIFSGLTRVR